MFYQTLIELAERSRLIGDVSAHFILAVVFAILMTRSEQKDVGKN